MIGASSIALPRTSRSDDKQPASAAEQLDGWQPPTVVYSLTTIGRQVDVDGVQMKCFTATEGREVLMPMFADYRALIRMSWLWVAAKAEYEASIATMGTKLKLQDGTIAFYTDESDHWYQVSKVKGNRLERAQRFTWVPWAIVVLESLLVGGLGVYAMATN